MSSLVGACVLALCDAGVLYNLVFEVAMCCVDCSSVLGAGFVD